MTLQRKLTKARAHAEAMRQRALASCAPDFVPIPPDSELHERRKELGGVLLQKLDWLRQRIRDSGVDDPVVMVMAPDDIDRDYYRAAAEVAQLEGDPAQADNLRRMATAPLTFLFRERPEVYEELRAVGGWGEDSLELLSKPAPPGALLYTYDSSWYGHGAALLFPMSEGGTA